MACQAPLSMGFSRRAHWSGLPFPSPVIKYEVSEVSEVKSLSRVRLFVTPWTVAFQAPPSMGLSRQEYWSGLQKCLITIINLKRLKLKATATHVEDLEAKQQRSKKEGINNKDKG